MVVWLVPVGGVVGVVVLVVVGVGVLPRPRHALAALAAVAAGRGHAASCRVQGDEAEFPKNVIMLPGLECGEAAVYCAPAATMARPGLACGDTGCAEVE